MWIVFLLFIIYKCICSEDYLSNWFKNTQISVIVVLQTLQTHKTHGAFGLRVLSVLRSGIFFVPVNSNEAIIENSTGVPDGGPCAVDVRELDERLVRLGIELNLRRIE